MKRLMKRFDRSLLVPLLALALASQTTPVQAADTKSPEPSKFPCSEAEVAHYTAHRTREKIKVDGRLDENSWKAVPRSPRFIDILSGKPTVHVDGTVNNDKDRDRGWTVELAFPWKGMEWLAKADHRSLPPKDKDVWRIDFSRFNQYKSAPPDQDSGGWVWSRHGIWDSHIPECFPYIHFSTQDVATLQKPADSRGQPTGPSR